MTALDRARAAARERLLNALFREVAAPPPGPGAVRIAVPGTDTALVAVLRRWSPSGHHRWDDEVLLDARSDQEAAVSGASIDPSPAPTTARARPADHDEVVGAVLAVAGADPGEPSTLAAAIAGSVERTARYLDAPPRPEPADAHARTRDAEQSVRFGHPFHPTPKSLEGSGPAAPALADLERVAPELGTSFRLQHLAVDPAVVVGDALDAASWIPDEVAAHVPAGFVALPVHPLQAAHLRTVAPITRLIDRGALVDLGPLGPEVYPTSSVRTVCAPGHPTMWKLPLHVRITNFVRTVPLEHAHRAIDASRVVAALRPGWSLPGFGVLVETGWRSLDPAVVGEDGAAEATVLFRENPFVRGGAPRVVAALVEDGPRGEEPGLVTEVRRSGDDPADWLRAYLRISLLPLLTLFGTHGLGLEAHVQNTLLETEHGRPHRFWVRDMEGAHVSRDRRPPTVPDGSPLLYDESEAWLRLRYHAVVNHLATVVAVLGHHVADERRLWGVVAETLATADGPHARELLTAPTLPAKANLLSRLHQRGEHPLYVEIANPIREAAAR